jgi:hypothetical protein
MTKSPHDLRHNRTPCRNFTLIESHGLHTYERDNSYFHPTWKIASGSRHVRVFLLFTKFKFKSSRIHEPCPFLCFITWDPAQKCLSSPQHVGHALSASSPRGILRLVSTNQPIPKLSGITFSSESPSTMNMRNLFLVDLSGCCTILSASLLCEILESSSIVLLLYSETTCTKRLANPSYGASSKPLS